MILRYEPFSATALTAAAATASPAFAATSGIAGIGATVAGAGMMTSSLAWLPSLSSVATGLGALSSVFGGVMQAGQSGQRGNFERDYFNMMADQEQKGLNRDLQSNALQKQQTLARSRAVMAGQGGGEDWTQNATTSGLFDQKSVSLIDDSQTRQQQFRSRAGFSSLAASNSAASAILGGVGQGAALGLSLLRK